VNAARAGSAGRPARACVRGFTLIEVLVAAAVLSIGLLGLGGLQLAAVHSTQSAYLRTQAAFLAYDIVDRMRANLGAARAGAYDVDFDTDTSGNALCIGVAADCAQEELADHDLRLWHATIAGFLGAGTGAIASAAVGGVTRATVTIRWVEATSAVEGGDVVPEQLTITANL
jgi:type IV pilus assembly protein PilV